MGINYQAELVGVLGQPVAENPTGVMQEAGFAAAGLNWRYLTMEVPPERLEAAIAGVRALGMRGINLTIPHKVNVIRFLDGLSEEARLIGAVNTVRRDGERLIGENTDGKGFLRGLRQDAGVDPDGKQVVLLGAGGAARAIAIELILAGSANLIVVNRGKERGQTLVTHLMDKTGAAVTLQPWEGTYIVPSDADILVNATSIGLYPNGKALPDISLAAARNDLLVCDAVFNPAVTALLALAKDRGMPVLDGLSMLVYQGVIGFEMWTGVKAPEAVMKRALARALAEC
ncbi:MAG: shikimate dehydrogenase [Acidobacteria bacterium]|nr:shikimate dehydrogenase [Acidobacteriota bacterium]